MSRYYSKDILKSSVCPCGPTYICILFAERTSGGPPMYICARNKNGRPLTLVYVHSRGHSWV
jgi:hypothetical protein